ncbi:hypothetical protein CVT26_014521 [Gymnopilus dilepis]|uniref:Uncharacterized protein n=1 Tax=Gymnopilus dilepis TaxID=231916 RepID=A0A409W3C1_9AGAR|nr:hypothetical protein CVT26_014521 [Gymnopilus dilepis]
MHVVKDTLTNVDIELFDPSAGWKRNIERVEVTKGYSNHDLMFEYAVYSAISTHSSALRQKKSLLTIPLYFDICVEFASQESDPPVHSVGFRPVVISGSHTRHTKHQSWLITLNALGPSMNGMIPLGTAAWLYLPKTVSVLLEENLG